MYIERRLAGIMTEEQLKRVMRVTGDSGYRQTHESQPNSNTGNFLKSMIKINNPTWTPDQIEAEFKKQMERKDNRDDNGCESCSG